MKVAILLSEPHDPNWRAEWIAKTLVSAKHKVEIFATNSDDYIYHENDLRDRFLIRRVSREFRFGLLTTKNFVRMLKYARALRDESADIYHVVGLAPLLPAIISNKKRMVIDLSETSDFGLVKSTYLGLCINLFRARVSAGIIKNSAIAQKFEKYGIKTYRGPLNLGVTYITWFDICGIINRTIESFEGTQHRIRGFEIERSPFFKSPKMLKLYKDIDLFDAAIKESDIIVYNENYYNKVRKSRDKKTIIYHHGTEYRDKQEFFKEADKKSDLILASTVDLLKFSSRALWFPSPVDLEFIESFKKKNNYKNFVVAHLATDRKAANTEVIITAIDNLKARGVRVELKIIENVSHHDAIDQLSTCDLLVDHMSEISYRIASVEAMALGIPVIKRASNEEVAQQLFGEVPYLSVDNSDELQAKIEMMINDDKLYRKYSKRGYSFAHKYHDAAALKGRLLNLFQSLLLEEPITQKTILEQREFGEEESLLKIYKDLR